jgi:hypothetical protein
MSPLQLDSLGIKIPKFYKKITFVDQSKANVTRHGIVVQKIKGAQDIKLVSS